MLLLLICSQVSATTVRYQHTDMLGSVVAESDSAGNIISRSHYEPFGKRLGGDKAGIGYTGHLQDEDLNLTYMQARYYDPLIGRFYANDPVGFRDVHSFNRYAYGNNNPYKYVDPDGKTGVLAYTPTSSPVGTTGMEKLSLEQQSAGVNAVMDAAPIVGDIKAIQEAASNPTGVNIAAAAIGAIPLIGDAAAAGIKGSKVFSKEKQALVEMAKMDKKNGGVTQGDMDAYAELNAELSDPFPSNQVRGLETHPDRANGSEPHGHVGPVNHIPEKKIED
ncbi:RHS repeat-associated core domain-containing protein [Shewanella indica]|uniref:RHS repeat domain-containing protein n=1 Tax=Shewanella indica TaxID=768528 RepID=UPI001F204F0D|nr:RHS repeat-associated core domain-containing protein [Shewanella indica]MCE9791966.1 RHS repeat-associated core domain-containing protein [Shewanella indica]